jgi:hypothetical protein
MRRKAAMARSWCSESSAPRAAHFSLSLEACVLPKRDVGQVERDRDERLRSQGNFDSPSVEVELLAETIGSGKEAA